MLTLTEFDWCLHQNWSTEEQKQAEMGRGIYINIYIEREGERENGVRSVECGVRSASGSGSASGGGGGIVGTEYVWVSGAVGVRMSEGESGRGRVSESESGREVDLSWTNSPLGKYVLNFSHAALLVD